MGQLALGFRSLLTKAAIFFVMAALLAWALGGTLWPRPHIVDHPAVELGGTEWWWRLTVGGNVERPQWTMMSRDRRGHVEPVQIGGEPLIFHEPLDSVLLEEGVIFGGKPADAGAGPWKLYHVSRGGLMRSWRVPDRLALEQQVVRLRAGLEVQDYETILRQRSRIIDPADDDPES